MQVLFVTILRCFDCFYLVVCRRLSSCIERQFKLVIHKDLPQDKIFIGEMNKLKSYVTQRP